MSDLLLIGGTFDHEGGRESSIADSLFQGIKNAGEFNRVCEKNGGSIGYLINVLKDEFKYIVWMAHVSNDEEKTVADIKKRWPKTILVTSKRCVEKDYKLEDVIQHALKIKSNLVLQIIRTKYDEKNLYMGRVIDPLGNLFRTEQEDSDWVDTGSDGYTSYFPRLGGVIGKRIVALANIKRVGSTRIGDKIAPWSDKDFFKEVRSLATKFDKLIVKPDKVSSNASFRCQKGFPSAKIDDFVFVSRRNIDKEFIGEDGFVAVSKHSLPVQYWGEHKPSVDTPVQLGLYNYYKNVNYIIHGHVYTEDGIFTKKNVPCGAMEEVAEVIAVEPDFTRANFSVNLLGHGTILLLRNLEYLKNVKYVTRPFPEVIT